MQRFKIGQSVSATMNIEGETVKVRGTITGLSPDRKHAKLRLDDDLELLIETRFLRGNNDNSSR